ncbi:MAG: hypothetical protein U0470_09570 [Anaerolineae bacterium]
MNRPAAAHPSAPTSTGRVRRALSAAGFMLVVGLALTACGTPPTATPEPAPVTALPEPATVVPVTDTPVVTATATLTPTATATEIVATQVPTVAVVAPSPVAAQPTAAVAPPTAAPTANSGAPVIDFYPDNGQFEVDKDQMCIAVNWHTENVTDVRLEWGGKPIAVAASGRQPDICFGEKKIELKLIYKHKDGREESRTIEVKHKG